MRSVGVWSGIICAVSVAAGSAQAEQPSIEVLMKKIDALQRRLDEVEGRERAAKRAAKLAAKPAPAAPYRQTAAPASTATTNPVAIAALPPSTAAAQQAAANSIPGLLAPEPMGSQFEDALRSDLPGLSLRIPGSASEVRVYGFAKASGYTDLNGRNQNNAPAVSGIPLRGSPADMQGGDSGMTGRFSRIGLDTRTLTSMGTLETRLEGDFGGGAAASNNMTFRLRQAWGELGTESFRVLVGQANSLWNEGMYETLNDSTNLNQSFVRQAQVRLTGRLAPGWTGMISLEAPETQAVSAAGFFNPENNFNGGASPAFNAVPDLLGRLNYRYNGLEFDTRGLVRDLNIRASGTALAPGLTQNKSTLGWGIASHVRFPMRWLSGSFGADQFIAMGYYGQGIGRYFAGNSGGQDLISNIGLASATTDFVQDALPTYGGTVAYRRFWAPELRSNFAYSYAKQDYPSYALQFTPASAQALALNGEMQQAIANLIWSPYATARNGTVDTGWLDVGLEYIYSKRNVFGGIAATTPAGEGYGVASRFTAAAVVRF